jgi:hypothetical protein
MLELQTATKSPSLPKWTAAPSDDPVRRFLIENERRVILHCGNLLDDPNPGQRRMAPVDAAAWRCRSQAAGPRCMSCNPKLTAKKSSQKIFGDTLEIEFGSSNSIFAACRRCRAPALGPAD